MVVLLCRKYFSGKPENVLINMDSVIKLSGFYKEKCGFLVIIFLKI